MKVIVVLAIAVLSGCHANLFYADEPKPQLEQLTDAFWDYVAKATQTAGDTLQTIKESQIGQEVNARLTESADQAKQYAVTLPTMTHDLLNKIHTEAEVLKERLVQDLSIVRGKMEPFAEDMKTKVQHKVEQLQHELTSYAESLDAEGMRAALVQKSEELKTSLDQSVKDMKEQLRPYTDDMKGIVDQHLQNFHKSVNPMVEGVMTVISGQAEHVHQLVAPYAEDLREKLDPYATDLQAQLTSLYESYVGH